MLSKLFKSYKKLGQYLIDSVNEVKNKNYKFTPAKKYTLFYCLIISFIITMLKPNSSEAFEGVIECKNKFGMTTIREFKSNKLVSTKVSTKPGEPFKTQSGFSDLSISKKGQSIEWTGTFVMKGVKYPVKSSIDLKTMSYYTDLNIFNLSSPQKRKVDQICTKK